MDKIFTTITLCAYAVRVHLPDVVEDEDEKKIRLKNLYDLLLTVKDVSITGYLLAFETNANRNHIQGFLGFNEPQLTEKTRQKYLRVFEKFYGSKGTGNYSIKKVRDIQEYTKYVLKEGNFIMKNLDLKVIESFKKMSYEKFDKKKITQELIDLEEYLVRTMNIKETYHKFIQLKAKYNQKIVPKHLEAIILGWVAKVNSRLVAEQTMGGYLTDVANEAWHYR